MRVDWSVAAVSSWFAVPRSRCGGDSSTGHEAIEGSLFPIVQCAVDVVVLHADARMVFVRDCCGRARTAHH